MEGKLHRFSFKRNNVKVFLFFLAFTSILWIFIQFSKNYTQEIEASVYYTNLPENEVINSSQTDQSIKLLLSGNGFRFVRYMFDKPVITLDAANADENSGNKYRFTLNKEDPEIKTQLDFEGTIIKLQKETLQLFTDTNVSKRVPVRLKSKIEYATGYGTDKAIDLQPDSVTISGSKSIIDTINYVTTELLSIKNLKNDFKGNLKIREADSTNDMQVQPKLVTTAITVHKITEGSQEVPVQLINVPKNKQITIFPKTVKVVYKINLDKIKKITASDFLVEADYKKAQLSNDFLILSLTTTPNDVKDVRLLTKKIQYVIIDDVVKNAND